MQQNVLQMGEATIASGTSQLQSGYEAENAMDNLLAPPLRFSIQESLTEKFVYFDLTNHAWAVDCMAIIDYHSGAYEFSVPGDASTEIEMQFKLEYWTGAAWSICSAYTYIPGTLADQWGSNLWSEFNSVTTQKLRLSTKLRTGGSFTDARIGAIMVGKRLSLTDPWAGQARSSRSRAIAGGNDEDSPVLYPRLASRRAFDVRLRMNTEDDRVTLERLFSGRGRPRGVTKNDLVRKRLDGYTACVLPDMWISSGSTFAGCIYGRATSGLQSTMLTGGQADVGIAFQEVT
jgi:hypothetical protein